jgi:hypothetical protein
MIAEFDSLEGYAASMGFKRYTVTFDIDSGVLEVPVFRLGDFGVGCHTFNSHDPWVVLTGDKMLACKSSCESALEVALGLFFDAVPEDIRH